MTHVIQTFEAVVPTERMRLNLSLDDSCIKLVAPNHPGALVVVAYEVQFSTDIIGGATETISDASLSSVTVLLVDEEKQENEEVTSTPSKVRFANDVDIWKVSLQSCLHDVCLIRARMLSLAQRICPPAHN